MRAVVYKEMGGVSVETVEDPRIGSPRDAILRVTSAAYAGSDLHMYEGRTVAEPGIVFGHEIMGIIEDVGDAVQWIKPGDRVVLPFNIACGFCFNCVRGYTNACLNVNPQGISGGYGYVGMGPFRGGQAEQVLVPFADFNCLKLPGREGDQLEDDFVLLADIFPTGYHAAIMAGVSTGSTVAIFGAGPVGLLSALSSFILGASQVFVVDYIKDRLNLAKKIGAVPIDFTKGDPVEQIKDLRTKKGLPPGEEKMIGVLCGIDAVGYQARNFNNPSEEKPTEVLDALARLVNPTGKVGIIGVYFPNDPHGVNEPAKMGNYLLPFGRFWQNGIQIGTGQAPVKRYNAYLRDLIIAGKAKPSFIVSHRLPLSAAPDAYKKFDARADGFTKIILKPQMEVH